MTCYKCMYIFFISLHWCSSCSDIKAGLPTSITVTQFWYWKLKATSQSFFYYHVRSSSSWFLKSDYVVLNYIAAKDIATDNGYLWVWNFSLFSTRTSWSEMATCCRWPCNVVRSTRTVRCLATRRWHLAMSTCRKCCSIRPTLRCRCTWGQRNMEKQWRLSWWCHFVASRLIRNLQVTWCLLMQVCSAVNVQAPASMVATS